MSKTYRSIRWVVVLGLAAFFVMVVAVPAVWRWRLAHTVESHLATIRAAGLPTSGEELNNWYAAVPDTENAALVMTQAFALIRTYPDSRSNEVTRLQLQARGQPLAAEQKRLLVSYVAMNEAALAKAREACMRPKCRYPVDLSHGFSALLPHLAKMKTLGQVAAFQAALAADSGQMGEATVPITTILGMAQTLDEEPVLISQLVRVALIRQATIALERLLNSGTPSATQLTNLATTFTATDQTNLMVRVLIGERAMAIPYFRMSRAEIMRWTQESEEGEQPPPRPPLSGPPPTLMRLTGFFERDLRYYLGVMETNITLASLPPPRNLEAANIFENTAQDAKQKWCVFSCLLLPALSGTAVSEARCFTDLRLARTALAIEQLRRRQGRLPESLDALVPQFLPVIPTDPFDGAPLRYRRLARGYVLYSVDRDGCDDGGHEKPARKKSMDKTSYDITFTVER